MARRIDKRAEDLQELDHRTRPAVRQQQRQRASMRRADVQEVDSQAVDLGAELRDVVEPRLQSPPVVAGAPVVAEFLDIRERHPLRPIGDRLALGPASPPEPVAQVVELRLGNLDTERGDLSRHSRAQDTAVALSRVGRPGAASVRPSSLTPRLGAGTNDEISGIAQMSYPTR